MPTIETYPAGKAYSAAKVPNRPYKDATEQVSKLFPGANTIGVFSKIESESQSALTLVIVDEEGSVPGAMGPLKSAIRGLTEAAGASYSAWSIFLTDM
ncbi:hypothetical protein C0992_011250 [Termitomyces sp. T32_za158]|nr:hypothetical protein C0992_011250 [Termitomyces sp. T32_za158]